MERARSISKSMVSYLRRAREHKEFLLRETKEFERGKRHLANMMGIKSDEMTQDDVDHAIKYLFPSGLFDKRARPIMKHPDLLYRAEKGAQFDIEGRPNHYLFYTVKPNYHESLSTLSQLLRDLNKYEDGKLAEGVLDPPTDSKYEMQGREWLSQPEFQDKLIETISQVEYDYLIKCLNHLANHPYSARAKSFIEGFSRELPERSMDLKLPEIKRDEATGQIYTDVEVRARGQWFNVKTVLNGTGKVDIEGKDILALPAPYLREVVYYPLRLTKMQDKVDIFAKAVLVPRHLSLPALVIAARYAVSTSLAAYLDIETRERLRLAGLLSIDVRSKERKKFGQEGARRKYTWKKR